MLKKTYLLIFIFSLPLSFLQAQTVIGKYAGEFMSIGVGGRALGMGSAFTSVTNDVTAGYWNPAGLAGLNYPQAALMHEEHFGSLVNYNYAAVAIPYDKDKSFGLSVIRLSIDGISDTRNALYDFNGDGILDIYNDRLDLSKITEFNNTDWVFYLTFAKRESDIFYWGANVKIINRSVAEYSATGIGFDIGAMYSPMERLWLGANLQDVTTTLVAWNTGRNELVTPTARVGASYLLDALGGEVTPALDLSLRFENRRFASTFNVGPISFDFNLGVEYKYKKVAAVRLGFNEVRQFTIGAGVTLPKLTIDYSFARMGRPELERLPDSHRISLILSLDVPQYQRISE